MALCYPRVVNASGHLAPGYNGHSIICMVTIGLGPGAAEIRMAPLISRVVIRF